MSGTKVTTDPASNNYIEEKSGMVTSDSLAAESIRAGGDFGANQQSTAISEQPSRGFSGKTTDTSGARKITSEDTNEEEQYTTQADMESSQKYSEDASDEATTSGRQGGIAPTSMWNNVDEKVLQPKGTNLEEGGTITGNEPNESFRADIGSRNDPGLAAEEKFTKMNADGVMSSGFKRDSKVVNESGAGYEALGDEEA